MSSLFSSCNFCMNTLIFCSFYVLFFLHISMLCLYSFWKSLSLSNSTYKSAFSFSSVANLFFRLLTSKFKFLIFRLTIVMVWNNSTTLSTYITYTATSSTNFGVLVGVVGFLDPSTNDPICYTNLFPSSNLNGGPFVDPSLLIGTCSPSGLNTIKGGCVSIVSVYSLVAYKPPCVYCYCCDYCCCWCYCWCKWCCKCWKCCGLPMVSI